VVEEARAQDTSTGPWPLLIAVASAIAAPLIAISLEEWLGLGPDWISDAILSVAFLTSTYLWLRLRGTRSRLSELERSQIALDSELALAARIQRSLLPPAPRPRGPDRWSAQMEPAGKVGGDLYDFVENKSGVLFILGDVSGKGVPAALLTSSTRALFRALARGTDDPAEVMERLSRTLYEDSDGLPYLTAVVGRLDHEQRTLRHVNAGHPPSLLLRGADVRRLDVGGPPAGMFPSSRYTAETVGLEPSDVVVAMTDGITEGLDNAGGDLRGVLRTTLAASPGTAAPDLICSGLMAASEKGLGIGGWHDDRTVVVLAVE
jgi:serine phosphatase RsbU (regulator of sigma subunit)